jgi:hypothetical protein
VGANIPIHKVVWGIAPTPPRAQRWRAPLASLVRALKGRMRKGHDEYGDRSWSRRPSELLDEISQELLDVVGWAVIANERINAIKSKLTEVEDEYSRRNRL